jgi:hypothetical protein
MASITPNPNSSSLPLHVPGWPLASVPGSGNLAPNGTTETVAASDSTSAPAEKRDQAVADAGHSNDRLA